MSVNVQVNTGIVDVRSYRLGPQIPLFGVEHREKAREVTSGDVEIVYLERDGFEMTKPFFWWVWDYTLGALLSKWVLFKSTQLIRRVLRDRIAKAEGIERKKLERRLADLGSSTTRQQVLDWARRNFGPNVMTELFEMRSSGLNATSKLMQHFCRHVACSQALDDVYNALGSFTIEKGLAFIPLAAAADGVGYFHNSCPSGQAIRNRYRIVARLHEQLICGEVLSVACGSAQPLIHALSERKRAETDTGVSVLLADVDKSAIDLAMHRADQAGVRSKLVPLLTQFAVLPKALEGTSFDHIEACGIIDYLQDERVVELCQMLHGKLKRGGTLLMSQMHHTRAAN
ncbi:class I SAM-dependent methyltransferase, partial [Candidatus Uhrbacteria bacterium]|nr:class I SAM-dependent methyltransferase [Candidatus Uhrbacteria bacterium]